MFLFPARPAFAGASALARLRTAAVVLLMLTMSRAYGADALALEEAIELAEEDAPSLLARAAAQRAAEALVTPATQLPDPELLFGVDNLPVTGSDAGSVTEDFMTMRRVGVMQEFPRKAKREARGERALAEVALERAELEVERSRVRENVARAWIDVSFVEQRIERLRAIAPLLDAQVTAADAAIAAGSRTVADGLAARALRSALEDRLIDSMGELAKARAELARWLPDDAERPLAGVPDVMRLDRSSVDVLGSVDRHRELVPFAARTRTAAAELELARQEKRPDWALEVSYGNRGPAYSDMLSVGFRVDLPLFAARRQDPVIASKRAMLDEIEAEREAARREHLVELRSALAIWEAAHKRVEHYTRVLLPLASDRAQAALAAYRGGRSDLSASLAAMSDLIEQELNAIERTAELARAWIALRYAFVLEE